MEEAVVTQGSKIIFVGPLAEAAEFVSVHRNLEKVDLNGQTLSPGFIDPHLHPT